MLLPHNELLVRGAATSDVADRKRGGRYGKSWQRETLRERDSRAHNPSTKPNHRVVCEDLYVRTIGTRRTKLRRTARDMSKNAVCETLFFVVYDNVAISREIDLRSVSENRPKKRPAAQKRVWDTDGLAWRVGVILRRAYFRNTVRDNENGRTSIRAENRIKGLLDGRASFVLQTRVTRSRWEKRAH